MNVTFTSEDIDQTRISTENLETLKQSYPLLDYETLARYLIANNNNVEAAEQQLRRADDLKREHWHVKKAQCIKEIAKGKAYVYGTDKEGHPLLILNVRLHIASDRDLKEMVLQTFWWTEQALARLPDNKSQFSVLLNRDGCENSDYDMEYMTYLSKAFQVYHCCVVVFQFIVVDQL
jgi:hypothetical protein